MATSIGGIAPWHAPTVDVAFDSGARAVCDGMRRFQGDEPVARGFTEHRPGVVVFWFDDHATTFDPCPRFARGIGGDYAIAGEGLGAGRISRVAVVAPGAVEAVSGEPPTGEPTIELELDRGEPQRVALAPLLRTAGHLSLGSVWVPDPAWPERPERAIS